ncbi:helix-turn-helix transcriptional regulator [Parabacteroides sp. PF5-6]|uniref:helix-turn-helix domain-containing protein n=1 Tax=Parabacteroides sp. PF5-6 TaxID=1742403 RepID=UPI0024072686|nr:helix-turn-helix transcriptional regulator [Parabacteroides sp. PF5-6]MDF9830473.1 HTH-type transcriptional regulator/antitoxin HipB [Parabacteroides sp. PF5-6]
MNVYDESKFINANVLLDVKYGKKGTPSREEFEKEAIAYYYGVILRDKRKELKMTQQSLADRVGLKRSYIAKVEKGETDLQISSFVRIAKALGMELELV